MDLEIDESLRRLPLRSIVAFAVRNARRVAPLVRTPEEVWIQNDLEASLRYAEEYVSGKARPELTPGMEITESGAVAIRDDIYLRTAGDPRYSSNKAMAEAAWSAMSARRAAQIAWVLKPGEAARHPTSGPLDWTAEDVVKAACGAWKAAREAAREAAKPDPIDESSPLDLAVQSDLTILEVIRLDVLPEAGQSINPGERGPLGPLWPHGAPAWYREAVSRQRPPEEPSGDSSLVVEVEVPEGLSDPEVLALVKQLAVEADDYHRALGGHGLKVESLTITGDARVPQGVPHV